MYILVTYDVNTTSLGGQARLRKVSRTCVAYGQRVQNSVFECKVTMSQYLLLKDELGKIIDMNRDSIRFYNLGKNQIEKIETLGINNTYDPDDVLIL